MALQRTKRGLGIRKIKTPDLGTPAKRTKLPLDRQTKIEIALARYADLPAPSLTPIDKLQERFKRAPAVISRAIKSAFCEGLVEVRERVPPMQSAQISDTRLGEGLKERYKLDRVVLVRRASNSGEGGAHSPLDIDRGLYDNLGCGAASLLPAVFRRGDDIAIGSGRGVYAAVSTMASTLLTQEDVTLRSLSGSVFAPEEQWLYWRDSDEAAALFMRSFPQSVRFEKIRSDLVFPSAAAMQAARRKTWLDKSFSVDCAIVGVGIMAPHHKFYEHAKAAEEKRHQPTRGAGPTYDLKSLTDITEQLIDLRHICDKYLAMSSFYTPVADISSFLFYVPPPPGVTVSNEDENRIVAAIKQINSQTLNAKDTDYAKMKNLILIAGSPSRAHVIKHLIVDCTAHFKVTMLVTDEAAAENLLA